MCLPLSCAVRMAKDYKSSGVAEKSLQHMLDEAANAGVNIEHAQKLVPAAVGLIAKYEVGISSVASHQDETFCSEQEEEFDVAKLKDYLKTKYEEQPFSCAGESEWFTSRRRKAKVNDVFKIFGSKSQLAKSDDVTDLSMFCMFNDITENYRDTGKYAEGFNKWDLANLEKHVGLTTVVSQIINKSAEISKLPTDLKNTGWAFTNFLRRMNPGFQTTDKMTLFKVQQRVTKAMIILVAPELYAQADNNKEDRKDLMRELQATLAENIGWAIDVETKLGGSMENVAVGKHVMELLNKCLRLDYANGKPVTSGTGVQRFVVLYNIWNIRFLQWYHSVRPQVACEEDRRQQYPFAVAHAVGSLAASHNLAATDLGDWLTLRVYTLSYVGMGVHQTCDGSFVWSPANPFGF